jgi:hypothetical protein
MISPRFRKTPGSSLRVVAAMSVLLAALAGAAPALAAETHAHWSLESRTAPENLPPGKEGMIIVTASNLGDAEVNGGASKSTVTITDTLPEGVEAIGVERSLDSTSSYTTKVKEERLSEFICPTKTGKQIKCTYTGKLPPYELLQLKIRVEAKEGPPSESKNEVTVSGGEAVPASLTLKRMVKVNKEPASFGVESFEMTAETEDFEPDVQAGSHPFQLTTTFNLNQGYEPAELDVPITNLPSAPALEKNLSFKLPPGLIGNVNAVKQCSDVEFGSDGEEFANACPNETVVGVASVTVFDPNAHGEYYATYVVPMFNLEPAAGEPARFGFSILHVPVVLDTSVRTGEDYGVTVSVHYASQAVQVLGSKVTFWGIPGDERHNPSRGWLCLGHGKPGEVDACGTPVKPSPPVEPLLMLPTGCGEHELLETSVSGEAWNTDHLRGPNEKANGEVPNGSPTELTGCGGLEFNPSIEVEPGTHEASTPTGLTVTVSLPQAGTMEPSYENKAEAAVSSTKLELPVGIQTSPGAANGLETCSVGQAGFSGAPADTGGALEHELGAQSFTSAAATCPKTAKIGTVNIKTPVLERELTGGVYLAQQDTNPFASPLVLYIVAEDKAPGEETTSKVLVKLAGEVTINPETGQLVSDFRKSPQSPFETLTLHLWGGARASQATPARCGSYPAKATFTNSSNAAKPEPKSEFQITSGPEGTPCPGSKLPFEPSFQAQSTDTQAGAFTPFTLTINRPDGDAALKTISMQLPAGLAAVLASVTPCPEPQAAEGTCGEESRIGQSVSSSGLGNAPYNLHGSVYLTGPYGGAPFGLSSVTSAVAGPFHLGKVVVRSSIAINPYTAAATIDTEAAKFIPEKGEAKEFSGLPEMLEGVPAQIKKLEVTIERSGFQFNPTSCTPTAITGTLTGYENTSAAVSTPFQVGNCASLPFKPTLTSTAGGQASKNNGASLDVKITSAGLGQANIHKVDLTLPKVLPSRLTTIQKACPEAVFDANPATCDEGSVIGKATVHTPVLKSPLTGPAYLVSHGGAAFPDVEFVLQAEGITLIVDGKTDIKNGITYSKFETSPDAPFTTFETELPTGPHSALTAYVPAKENYNLCKTSLTMPTEITGQNGAVISQATSIAASGCQGVKASKAVKLSQAQKLAKALKACKKDKQKSKRLACEKQARKKYGAKPAKKKAAKKK